MYAGVYVALLHILWALAVYGPSPSIASLIAYVILLVATIDAARYVYRTQFAKPHTEGK